MKISYPQRSKLTHQELSAISHGRFQPTDKCSVISMSRMKVMWLDGVVYWGRGMKEANNEGNMHQETETDSKWSELRPGPPPIYNTISCLCHHYADIQIWDTVHKLQTLDQFIFLPNYPLPKENAIILQSKTWVMEVGIYLWKLFKILLSRQRLQRLTTTIGWLVFDEVHCITEW